MIATELDPANSLRRTAKCISSTTAPNPPSRTSAISSIPSHPAKLWENEAAGHHADLNVTWGKLWVKLATHSAGGITDKDFTLARKIEDTVLWRPDPDGPLDGPMGKFVFSKSPTGARG